MKHWFLALALALGSVAAAAAPVYRCGGGSYSQTPCPGGKVVDATDPRSAAQRAEARRVAATERRKAREMERERLAQEKQARKEPAIASLGPQRAASAPARAASQPSSRGKTRQPPKDFTAVAPATGRP